MSKNIGNSIDPFYRYRRPISIVTHRKNFTIIKNLTEIAKALETEPDYILHYIKLTKSVSITNKLEIKSVIQLEQIEDLIDKFIDEFILCENCILPEIVIKPSHTKLYFSCKACGHLKNIPKNKFTRIMYKKYFLIP